jgi:hypothetical protein
MPQERRIFAAGREWEEFRRWRRSERSSKGGAERVREEMLEGEKEREGGGEVGRAGAGLWRDVTVWRSEAKERLK